MTFFSLSNSSNQKKVWEALAQEIGGRYRDEVLGMFQRVQLNYERWEIVLDTYPMRTSRHSSKTYTRIRAPFINQGNFYFEIYQESVVSSIGKFFGMQDIEINDPFFDEKFIIKSNDEEKVKQLLASDELKALFIKQPDILFAIRDCKAYVAQNAPGNIDELYFHVPYILTDIERLKELFDLFILTLNLLVELDVAKFRRTGFHLE